MSEDPVEILVKMAERGEIDPWNIDIIEVTDRFFSEMEKQQVLDLRLSARTLLYAAILLRIKSDYLNEPDCSDCDDADGSYMDSDDDVDSSPYSMSHQNPILFLEHEIKRRLDRKNMRRQPITLYDLIAILRNAEKEDRRRQRDSWVHDGLVFTEEIISIAHEEAFHESSIQVLDCCYNCLNGSERVALSEVARKLEWHPAHVFIPLLFLMQEGEVDLHQETFFGEVYITLTNGGSAVVSDIPVMYTV